MVLKRMVAAAAALGALVPCGAAVAGPVPAAVLADPALDPAAPAAMEPVRIPTAGLLINGVLYLASGKAPHRTLLLHGFPGNEQNLDLAQAARRAGWNVLTLHYRGSWGSPGVYSFAHCTQDAAAAVAFLRDSANAAKYRIDPARLAVAGHSLGGMMAARVLADDPALLGGFLIDPADLAGIGRQMKSDPKFFAAFKAGEIDGDMPPLNAEEADIVAEFEAADPKIDLIAAVGAMKGRRLAVYSAERGLGPNHPAVVAAAQAAGVAALTQAILPTDHSFSDHRIALAAALVDWLATLTGKPH